MPRLVRHVPNQRTCIDSSLQSCSACLRCINKRCMFFKTTEVEPDNIENYPFDKNNQVCPVQAISEAEDGSINIDHEKCIMCGLCAKRCPIGAIYYKNNKAIVNTDKTDHIILSHSEQNIRKQEEQLQKLSTLQKRGTLIEESDDLLTQIYEKLTNIDNKQYDLVVRNLLIGAGCSAGKRRAGDVYTRTDIIYASKDGCIGAAEVEFGQETLDASRAILEDIAVMNVKYSISKEQNYPLVVCLNLPNSRQGYWQVIKDIRQIENIKIQTLSVGALFLLNWNNIQLSISNFDFYIDFDNKILRTKLEEVLGRKINISPKQLGILEPYK